MQFRKNYLIGTLLLLVAFAPGSAHARAKRPNILVIFGDDIGQANISAFTKGLMGYCTAGQSAFITGQVVFRTGLSKVGLPVAPVGLHRGGLHDHPKS